MYTTVNEDGILNNYPTEPKMNFAEYPAIWEQRQYLIQGVFATLLVTTLVLVAFTPHSAPQLSQTVITE